MDRRHFVKAGLAAGALAPSSLAAAAPEDRRWYELRIYETRSDLAPGRLRPFLQNAMLPALRRAGAGTTGVFTPEVGMLGQSVVVLAEYRSGADAVDATRRLEADAEFVAARRTFDGEPQPPFVRYEARLMRAFAGHPAIEAPAGAGDASRPARLFELRTYESRDAETLAQKIGMFDGAEIALFRSIGMMPVFFGENVFATRLPSLTYMLSFESLSAREKAWAAFRTHPEWQRIQKDPRWTAATGITTVTSSVLLNPLPFSAVR